MLKDLSLAEAAEHVGIKESAFRRLLAAGTGPTGRKDGRTLRFLPAHLDKWAEEYAQNAYNDTLSSAKPKGKPGKGGKAKTKDILD